MKKRTAFALALGWALILALLILVGGGSSTYASTGATTRYVAPHGNCGSATPCYASIQAAVDAAANGDVIKIAQGTYRGVSKRHGLTQTVYLNKNLTLRGGFTPTDWNTYSPDTHLTTLDAQGKGRVLYITGSGNPVVKGIYITGGNAQGLGGTPWGDGGGGIYVDKATATLSDFVIYSNTAQYGGGIYLHKAAARVHDNRIHHNGVFGETTGGGMYLFLQ